MKTELVTEGVKENEILQSTLTLSVTELTVAIGQPSKISILV